MADRVDLIAFIPRKIVFKETTDSEKCCIQSPYSIDFVEQIALLNRWWAKVVVYRKSETYISSAKRHSRSPIKNAEPHARYANVAIPNTLPQTTTMFFVQSRWQLQTMTDDRESK